MTRHLLPHGEIIRARVEEVYPTIADGSVTLTVMDGPYGMGKADWDKVRDLAAFYRPHIAEVSRVSAPSASVYFWNTHDGLIDVDPVWRAAGWTRRAVVTWDKGIGFLAGKGIADTRTWLDVTEVCALYVREPNEVDLWNEWGDAHPVRRYLDGARARAGLTNREVDDALGVSGMARHWFTWTQWCLPSAERYDQLRALLPGLTRSLDDLRAEHAELWSAFRAQWEAIRAPFNPTMGVTNVWTHPQVQGAERLTGADGATLHPCQKPLLFARRIIEASSRPGETVFVPFGGTCRESVANEQIARLNPEDARRVVTVEQDEDGRDYIGAVLRSLGELPPAERGGQLGLFGGAA